MTDFAMLKQQVMQGNVDAFIPLADELNDEGHPHAEELAKLAVDISTETDWAVVLLSIAVFEELLSQGNPS